MVYAAGSTLGGVSPSLLWALMNLLQQYSYLLLLSIDYPIVLAEFLEIFRLGNLDFIPNVAVNFIEFEEVKSPPKFMENEFTGLFLDSAGPIL